MKTIPIEEARAIHDAEIARITARGQETEPIADEVRRATRTMVHAHLQELNRDVQPTGHGAQTDHFSELWKLTDATIAQLGV